jgi:DNA-directed RNA polymerase specialized sigma subunit
VIERQVDGVTTREWLHGFIETLTPQEQNVCQMILHEGEWSSTVIGKRLGVSHQRVHQLKNQIKRKMFAAAGQMSFAMSFSDAR